MMTRDEAFDAFRHLLWRESPSLNLDWRAAVHNAAVDYANAAAREAVAEIREATQKIFAGAKP